MFLMTSKDSEDKLIFSLLLPLQHPSENRATGKFYIMSTHDFHEQQTVWDIIHWKP